MIHLLLKFYDTENCSADQHALGLALLREGLIRFHGLDREDTLHLRFETGLHGKPALADYPEIHFNISHCPGLVVCATADIPIGTDAEYIRDFKESLVRKTLTGSEAAFLTSGAGTSEDCRTLFFRFWTLKEARLKLSGEGLTRELTGFSFRFPDHFDIGTSVTKEISCSEPDVFCRQLLLKNRYVLSLCSGVPAEELTITEH